MIVGFHSLHTPIKLRPVTVRQRNLGGICCETIPKSPNEFEALVYAEVLDIDFSSCHLAIIRFGRLYAGCDFFLFRAVI